MEYVYAGMLIHKLGGTLDEATVKKVIESAGGKPDEGQAKAVITAIARNQIPNVSIKY